MPQNKKPKHFSRKKKSVWRKHVNIDDVEDFLEEQRLEERIGKAADRSDAELFKVDTKSDDAPVKLTDKQRRKLQAQKPPRSFASLDNTSKVEDPIKKRNRVRTREERRRHPIAKSKEEARTLLGLVPKRLQAAAKQRQLARAEQRDRKRSKKPTFDRDLWADEEQEPIPEALKTDWVARNVVEHTMANVGKPLVKTPGETHKKRSKARAIDLPHPGTSYNPAVEDHQELVEKVVEREEKFIREEEHLERVTTRMFAKMTPAQVEKLKERELIEGLPIDKTAAKGEASDDDDEYKTVNPPVRNKKKDRKTRRKQQEAKKRRAEEERQRQEVKKIVDIGAVPKFKREIGKAEQRVEKKRENAAKRREARKFQAGRLGRIKFVEPEIDVALLEDVPDSLRTLKPEGNLLLDRFKSLQKRNILPSGVLRGHKRKTHVKKYIKKSHKEEPVVGPKKKIKAPKIKFHE